MRCCVLDRLVFLCLFVFLELGLVVFVQGLDLQGRWTENSYKRNGLNDFLYDIGMAWYKRLYVRAVNWDDEQTIFQDGFKFRINGLRGPHSHVFSHNFIADNQTLSRIDMGELGGLMDARAVILGPEGLPILPASLPAPASSNDIKRTPGGTLVVYVSNKETGTIELMLTRTRKGDSRELLNEFKHVSSGSVLKTYFYKQG